MFRNLGNFKCKIPLASLKFFGIATGVATAIVLVGIAVTRQQDLSQVAEAKQTSSALPKLLHPQADSPLLPALSKSTTLPKLLNRSQINTVELAYNVKVPPNLSKSQELQNIVEQVVDLAAKRKLPIQPLSITLINTKTGEFAEYQQENLRYPASVVKMFWLVYLYSQIEHKYVDEAVVSSDLIEMIKKSDNEAASQLMDLMTNTQSGSSLKREEYISWMEKRKQINRFFEKAGYKNLNASQKVFPIPYLKLFEPQGRDLQIREDLRTPVRNKITTQQAARLLYEIFIEKQTGSPTSNAKIVELLTVDAATRMKDREQASPDRFNSVYGFLSQSLPLNIKFAGKAGWTSKSRQEAAYIETPDGKAAYILVVFGDDRAYAYDWKLFPKMSRLVFERMTK